METRNPGDIDIKEYDFLIIGAGLYGAVMARELTDRGYHVLVLEKRSHIAGTCFTEEEDGITVHRYGPHIFHTGNEEVWRYVNRFADFRPFINRPVAVYKGERFPLPFNMKTFEKMWGIQDPEEARRIILSQSKTACIDSEEAANLEEQAIRMVGTDIYDSLIKGYSEKQWGRSCRELPAAFIRRLPVRFDFNDSYYDDKYQAVPKGGYTQMVAKILDGIDVITGADYNDPEIRERFGRSDVKVICSGSIDAYYGYRYGRLEFRSLRFEEERIDGVRYYQDRAVINYTDADIPYMRVTEHKHFAADPETAPKDFTIITREYPVAHSEENDPLYPVGDSKNIALYEKYRRLADSEGIVHFGGRLGSFRYYDMDDVIASALKDAERITERK